MNQSLNDRINEVFLWHGTSPGASVAIASGGFDMSFCGTGAGSMYGSGLYFAECSSKSDEYSKSDQDGIYWGMFCFLLCRVTLGEVLHLTAGGESTHAMIKAGIENGAYDAVLGDRQASVGTYREFVTYAADQVYPEYVILYSRED